MSEAFEKAIDAEEFARRGARVALAATICVLLVPTMPAHAQTPTSNPGAWRPVSYADLQRPSHATATYADIWRDAIEANNRVYIARGDRRFIGANAPAIEAHFVIWSPQKSIVLSVLDTAIGCSTRFVDRSAHARVRFCPMRIAIYRGMQIRTMDGGKACFLEIEAPQPGASADPTSSVAYVAYDVGAKTIKTGMIVNHKAVDGCSTTIPIPAS